MKRGTYDFEVNSRGYLINSEMNVDILRRLWLDRKMVTGDDLGPGDPGDFDYGAWHVACHVVAAAGVLKIPDGRVLWLEISHDPGKDEYFACVTGEVGGLSKTYHIDSSEGRAILQESKLLGFVEGNSLGHISARGVRDSGNLFLGYKRQEYDQPVNSPEDGGKVWEHWCTVRDIRSSHRIGTSVLRSYVTLVTVLGDLFVPTVARGRRDYGHPKQLCAMIRAGLTSEESARWDTFPFPIPIPTEHLLLESRPQDSLAAVKQLTWTDTPRYYMFQRRILSWNPAAAVKKDLQSFGSSKPL
jgi:hypothetical protein